MFIALGKFYFNGGFWYQKDPSVINNTSVATKQSKQQAKTSLFDSLTIPMHKAIGNYCW
jgi:hypothetical protein